MNQQMVELIKEIWLRSFFQNRLDSQIPVLSFEECKTIAEQIQSGLLQLTNSSQQI